MTYDYQSFYDIDPDDLEVEQVDELTAQLMQVKEESIDEIDLIRHLFSLCKSVMQLKCVQSSESTIRRSSDESPVDARVAETVSNVEPEEHVTVINDLNNSLKEKESTLQQVQIQLKQLTKTLEITNQEKQIISGEIDTLRAELSRREDSQDFYSENHNYLEKIREKNGQITKLLDELKQLEEENGALSVKVTRLSSSLNRATYEIEVSTEEMSKLREDYRLTIEMNKNLLKEKASLMRRMNSLKEKVEFYEEEDLSNKLTTRIDQVIDMIEEKDNEIYSLKRELSNFKTSTIDESSKQSKLDIITGKLSLDSMTQGNVLRSYLADAARVMDEQNDLIESLRDQICKSRSESINNLTDINKSSGRSSISSLREYDGNLEEELTAKDTEIIELRKQLFVYENQNFGLKEATAELKRTKEREKQLQEKLGEMTNQLNQLHMQLTDAEDECDYIRECAKMKGIESDYIPRNKDTRRDKLEILKLQQQLVQLEEDKILLQEKVRSLCGSNSRESDAPVNNQSVDGCEQVQQIAPQVEEEMRELREQNEALELGMKEILLAIQQTDSRSDAVVDCPTLERLCQVLESRTVSPSLGPVIALKAELDLVRGNNQQLRTELKRIRQEHLSLLAIYTEEILALSEVEVKSSNSGPRMRETGEFGDESLDLDTLYDEKTDEPAELSNNQQTPSTRVESDSRRQSTQEPSGEFETAIPTATESRSVQNDQSRVVVEETYSDEDEMELRSHRDAKSKLGGESKDKFIELTDAQVQVDLVLTDHRQIETRETATMTEVFGESEVNQRKSEPSAKCEKCIALSKTIKNLMSRLVCLEEKVKSVDEETRKKVCHLQDDHASEVEQLQRRLLEEQNIVKNKDFIIERLNKQIMESVPKVGTNRRETQVISRNDVQLSSSSSTATAAATGLIALPDLPSALVPSATAANLTGNLTNIVQGIIECLESRIEHKETFIKQYEERIREFKESLDVEVKNAICKLQGHYSRDECLQDSLKVIMENETLKSRLKVATSCLNEEREQSQRRISELERQVEEEKNKLQETQLALASAKKKSSFNQIVALKNEVNQHQQELKAKESLIQSLHKRLQEESRSRLANTRVKVKQTNSGNDAISASTMNSFVDHLKSQLESKEKQLKQIELTKWTNDKKLQEKLQLVERQLQREKKENEKLQETVKRLKVMVERSSKLIAPKSKSVATVATSVEASDREKELKTLLEESYKREKLAALKLMTTKVPNINLEDNLLLENAQLKVDLRMAEYRLSQETRGKSK